MFTGIVEELGRVESLDRVDDSARLAVHGPLVTRDARPGDSIAVNGVCLTVVSREAGVFTVDVMRESLDRSSLARLDVGSPVNLERAVRVQDRLGGHLVQGHVDGTATVIGLTAAKQWTVVRMSLPAELARYVVEKGSITVDGVSLTVSSVGADWFEVSLIPTTLATTTMGSAAPGTTVNVEVDVMAKYVEKLLLERLPAGAGPPTGPGHAGDTV